MRLALDARMLDHSGVGVYLSHVLPRIAERCAPLRPVVLALPGLEERVRSLMAGSGAEVRAWDAQPLSMADLFPPPGIGGDYLWWAPHFNVPLLGRSPLVVTIHDILPAALGGSLSPRGRAVRAWLGAIRRRARRVVCSSSFTRDEVARIGRIEPSRMDVVLLGTAPLPAVLTPETRAGPYWLFVGLVKPHKNLCGLLRAFASLPAETAGSLVVVGRHSSLREVDREALALAARLAPRVEVLEDVPRERLLALMAGATALVQPSFYEGFGLPPLEAMALGTPVIAARAASLPEVCGEAALYCDPRSPQDIARCMGELAADPGLRARLAALGRARAAQLTWEACAERTGEIVRRACGPA